MRRAFVQSLVIAALATGLPACPKTQPRTAETPQEAPGEPLIDTSAADRERRKAKEAAAQAARIAERKKIKKEDKEVLWGRGEEQRGAQNFKDAALAYTAFVTHYPADPRAGEAAVHAMQTRFALNDYLEGLNIAEDALVMIETAAMRARLARVVGNAYLAIPHWGTEAAGELLRGQWGQGKQTHTFRRDRRRAIEHLERARDAFTTLQAAGTVELNERIDVQLDLVHAIARFTPYDAQWSHWWYGWAESEDDDRVEAEGDDERVGKGRRWGWSWYDQLAQVKPRGLPVSTSGEVIFVSRPMAYGEDLNDTAKLKYLLEEIRQVDTSAEKERAAESLVVQGLLFRARDGVERLQRLSSWYYRGSRPFQKDVEGRALHTLKENQALGLVATHLDVYELPDDESFAALMRRVMKEHPKSKAADQAGYFLGQFFQSRAQYDLARAAYKAHADAYPKGTWHSSSTSMLTELDRPELAFVEMGVQPAGRPAKLNLKFRNASEVQIKTRKVDLEKLLKDFKKQYREGRKTKNWSNELPRPSEIGWVLYHDQNEALKKYATKPGPSFKRALKPDASGRYADAQLDTPIDRAGLYVVEAFVEGNPNRLARGLLLVEAIALVQKPTQDGTLMWTVDAATGEPRAGAQIEVFEYWNKWVKNQVIYRSSTKRLQSDQGGVVRTTTSQQFLAVARHKGEVSVTGFGYGYGRWSRSRPGDDNVAFVQPDRPVYRPNDEVQLKVFARERRGGVYKPATDVKRIRVRVYDPQNQTVLDKTEEANSFGAVDVDFTLGAMAPLGEYRVNIEADGQWTRSHQTFRVEEYKPPEFTVSVESAGEAHLGEAVPVAIKGTYLFGGPVIDAKVRYKVYRSDYKHEYVTPARWDWLYGLGYGRCYYVYDWFDWWRWAPAPAVWYPWWGPPPEPAKELVLEGEGQLDGEGKLEIKVDSAAAARDFAETDHRYTVEAEVTDLSRRLIKGSGDVLVTRAGYFANLELDRGWYRSGDELIAHIATQRPDGKLFATKGKLVVERVLYTGESGAQVTEKVIETIPVTTRAEAPIRVTWRAPKTGQYTLSFVGKDTSGREVRSSASAWVAGPGFQGREHRFQDLELRTDKRSYAPGDTLKLLVNTAVADAHILLSLRAEAGRMLDAKVIKMKGRSMVIDVPVAEGDMPNFFIEAVTVRDGELITEVREVFVPPQNTELNIDVQASKATYGPGEEVELTVKTTDGDGKPTAAEVALSIFDSAVLYIQPELVPAIRAHFWAQRRGHNQQGTSNLAIKFNFGDTLSHPDRQAGYALTRAQNEYKQQAAGFASADGDLRGSDSLRSAKKESKKDASGVGGLGLSGTGRGAGGVGGKLASRQALAKAKSPAEAPMAEAESRAEPKGGARERDRADSPDDRENNASSSAGATATRIRKNFADTAHFAPVVHTGEDGVATVKFKLPDNLTTWQVKAVGLDGVARAGEARTTFISTKDLLIRLQAPRFFRERDRVVLSAIVHNKGDKARDADVQLRVSEDLLVPEGGTKRKVRVPASGDVRVDFWVKVRGEGRALVRMDVVSGKDSDAKELGFPVLVHGLVKTISKVASVPMGKGAAEKTVKLAIPKERRENLTTLHVRFSPSLAGGMLDALPYLLDYPYGCTEQTLSRFVPAVLTRKALQQSGGLKLEDLKKATNLNPQELTKDGKEEKKRSDHDHGYYNRSPVFSSAHMDRMITAGVRRLAQMQNGDGGWGWWGSDGSSMYTTAHVVDGLLDARAADVRLPNGMLERGIQALLQQTQARMKRRHAKDWVSNEDAFAIYALSRDKKENKELADLLFKRRSDLAAYGKLLIALGLHNLGDKRSVLVLQNVEQLIEDDDENETSWIETKRAGWWYWWNNDVETNALYLRALDSMKKGDKRAPRVIKWLLNNRQNGYYWRSTRDTARVISSFANHMQVSGERDADMDVEILLDGEVLRTVHIDKGNLLTFDGEIVLAGKDLTTGEHALTFRRKSGKGAIYASAYLSYFSTEEDVEGAGLEIKVERKYSKLVRDDRVKTVQGDHGRDVLSRQVAYSKVPLKSGAKLKSGDLVLVELTLESKNDYTFLAFEDPKPAGMEPVALRSGTTFGEAVANMELRDTKTVFFLRRLDRGKRVISYRLRAEIPGEFHTMPTFGFGMYATELRATSDEFRVSIED